MTIWKVPLNLAAQSQTLHLPTGAIPLSAQMQNGILCCWMLVNVKSQTEVCRRFHVVGTGREAPNIEQCEFIDTVQDKPDVWHVFVEPETADKMRFTNGGK